MTNKATDALVVGAGRFGLHYVRILAQLNSRRYANVPRIGKLILTCTTKAGARDVVNAVDTGPPNSLEAVIAEKVANARELTQLLQRYRPGFIAIVARDRVKGDSIHAPYARIALSQGAVLCEKPFMPAQGDGTSLAALKVIKALTCTHPLGMELPMAVVAHQIQQNPLIAEAASKAGSIRFVWESAVRGGVDVVDDLVLHPWSMLAPEYDICVTNVLKHQNRADIQLQLTHRQKRHRLPCNILLVKGGHRRCMSLDDMTLVFRSDGPWVRVYQVEGPATDSAALQLRLKSAREVLAVYNPIEQHIVAMLQRHPIVGLDRIIQSQLLLEQLHGYSPAD